MERVKKYRVRRITPTKFRVINPSGSVVENENGNASNYGSYKAAICALRKYESGEVKEPHPLIE